MTFANKIRDPIANHMLTPQNVATVINDFHPVSKSHLLSFLQLSAERTTQRSWRELVEQA